MAFSLSVKLAYANGGFDYFLEECLDYLTSIHFVLMHIEENRIDDIIEESKRILKLIPFEIKPYFQVV